MNFKILADRITQRHEFLSRSIGVFQEEMESVDNVNILYNVAVWVVPALSLMELALYILYQKMVRVNF